MTLPGHVIDDRGKVAVTHEGIQTNTTQTNASGPIDAFFGNSMVRLFLAFLIIEYVYSAAGDFYTGFVEGVRSVGGF